MDLYEDKKNHSRVESVRLRYRAKPLAIAKFIPREASTTWEHVSCADNVPILHTTRVLLAPSFGAARLDMSSQKE